MWQAKKDSHLFTVAPTCLLLPPYLYTVAPKRVYCGRPHMLRKFYCVIFIHKMIVSCIPEFSSPKCKKPAIPHNSTFLRTEWRHKLSIFCAECIAVKLQIAQNVA